MSQTHLDTIHSLTHTILHIIVYNIITIIKNNIHTHPHFNSIIKQRRNMSLPLHTRLKFKHVINISISFVFLLHKPL